MEQKIDILQHFTMMVIGSLILFFVVIRVVLGKQKFIRNTYPIILLSVLVVVVGMLFGKYGANYGLKWWIYYPVPMLMNVLLPPFVLKMNLKKTFLYLLLSFLSAPVIHIFFSFFFGWTEYMPFWNVPYLKTMI
jgi:hypothetical protein